MVARTCGNWGEGANHTLGDRCAFWLDWNLAAEDHNVHALRVPSPLVQNRT